MYSKVKTVAVLLLTVACLVVAKDSEIIPVMGTTLIREVDGAKMVYVPAGSFELGSSDKQLDNAMQECRETYREAGGCNRNLYMHEQPLHRVILDAFWLDETEVTNAKFCKFLNANGNKSEEGVYWFEPGAGHRKVVYGYIEEVDGMFIPKAGYEDHPVVEVSWYGASAYCRWIGGRLPTEAEWEYAARGPSSFVYPWGNEFNGILVNYRDSCFTYDNKGIDTAFNDGHAMWAPVGSYPNGSSWCGALDMAGNVHEWVGDWWAPDYYSVSPARNPQGPETGSIKVGRGGSWYDPKWHIRSSYRKGLTLSSARMHWIGFRCVIPIE